MPTFTSGPTITAVEMNGTTIRYTPSEPGWMYYLILNNGAPTPSAAQIYTNYDGYQTSSSVYSRTLDIVGLSSSTDYDIYFTFRDNNANYMNPVKIDLRTGDPISSSDINTALDHPGLNWTISGDWIVATDEYTTGTSSVQSANHSNDSTAYIQADVVGSSVSFDVKVSSEMNYDLFHFYIEGTEVVELSGNKDWTNIVFPLSGPSTLRWEYEKDYILDRYSDCVWIDNVVITP